MIVDLVSWFNGQNKTMSSVSLDHSFMETTFMIQL
jgi:hypothetical protein